MPALPPPNIRLQNYLSTTTLHVHWDAINSDQANGILLGYKITYELYKKAAEEVGAAKVTVIKTVDKFTLGLLMTDLESFATYKVTATGYTQRGDGPISYPIYGGKTLLFLFLVLRRFCSVFC